MRGATSSGAIHLHKFGVWRALARNRKTLMQDRPLSTAEVSAMLGVPEPTLRYWRHLAPALGPKSYCLGRKKVVYDLADVIEWREARKAETARGGVV